jgi:hypothetical protein
VVVNDCYATGSGHRAKVLAEDCFGSIRAGRRRAQFGHDPPLAPAGNWTFGRPLRLNNGLSTHLVIHILTG